MRKIAQFLTAVALGVAALGAQAQIVTNGSFSDGTLGWTSPSGNGFTVTTGADRFAVVNEGQDLASASFNLEWNTRYLLSFTALGSGTVAMSQLPFLLSTTPGGAGSATQVFGTGTASYYFDTGVATLLGTPYSRIKFSTAAGQSFAVDNVSLNVTAVPEPETYAMMLAGLGAIGFLSRRRKQAA